MRVDRAQAYFQGKKGLPKKSCFQSVIATFQDVFPCALDGRDYPGGSAPLGTCGALHAAELLLERMPGKQEQCREHFLSVCGTDRCRDIRQAGMKSCLECVTVVVRFLQGTIGAGLEQGTEG